MTPRVPRERLEAIARDKRAGMEWKAVAKKHKCALRTIQNALKTVPEKKSPIKITIKKKASAGSELEAVNAALAHAANKPADRWYVAHNGKLATLEPCATKAKALAVCLAAHSRGKTVKLLKEIPFKLTIVLDE